MPISERENIYFKLDMTFQGVVIDPEFAEQYYREFLGYMEELKKLDRENKE